MKCAFSLVSLLLISLTSVLAQVSTQLANVTEGSPNNSAGLGVTFTNGLMTDGDLYFRGSSNGFNEAIWRTDGTVSGTRIVLNEGDDFGGNWSSLYFLGDGVLIEGADGYKFLSDGDNQLSEYLPAMPARFLRGFTQLPDGNYIFMTEENDVHDLFIASSDFEDVSLVGDVHPDGSEVVAYGGSQGVLIYNGNSFQESTPVVYDFATEQTMPLATYMAEAGLSLSDLSEGYVYGDHMFLSYRDEDNFFRDHVINMVTGAVAEFTFLRAPYTVHEYGDKLVILASRDAIVFDPLDMSHQFLYEDVFALGSSQVIGDKLYFIAADDDNTERVVEADLTTASSRFLPNAPTGRNFYNCKMLDYNDEFYYLSEDEHVTLMKYDFAAEAPILVDTLSVVTGATVVHDLDEVNGELIFSKRLGFLQHEPFVLGNGGTTSTVTVPVEELAVAPTIATDYVTITGVGTVQSKLGMVQIVNTAGQSYGAFAIDTNRLHIGELPAGRYYGTVSDGAVLYRLSFVKL